jgi:outer membrane lipopolysaccharide assembly protein LptE/RlpB
MEYSMKRIMVLGLMLATLSACGFQPRGSYAIPDSIGTVKVSNVDSYSALTDGLQSMLNRSNSNKASGDANSAKLKIYSESWATTPLSIDQFAQVREYITRYSVQFDMVAADGSVLVPMQKIDLSREYTYDINVAIGNPAEQEVIQRELRRDMQAAIMRRMDIMLRTKK